MPSRPSRVYNFILITLTISCLGCGSLKSSLTLSSSLTIGMLGVFTIPPGAVGNNNPQSEDFTLQAASILTSDGKITQAYAGTPKLFHILDRPQILVEYDITSLVDATIKAVTVQFDPEVTAAGKYNSALGLTLLANTVTFDTPTVVAKNKKIRLDISVAWQNTITRDTAAKTETIVPPTLSMALSDNGVGN